MKKGRNYEKRYQERIQHIRAHIAWIDQARISKLVHYLENDLGDPAACAMQLSGLEQAKSMLAWFEQGDLTLTRQLFYVCGLLDQHSYKLEIAANKRFTSPGPMNFELLGPLVSNNRELIQWFANCDAVHDAELIEREKSDQFLFYQTIVALRGEWDRLAERCERGIKNHAVKHKAWVDYYHFYHALALGDKTKMEDVLAEMVSPKKVRTRVGEEYAFTENLIFSRVVIGMKVAWMHGYEVEVDSPYVPMEWMPMTPNAQYDKHYDFLKEE